MHSNTSAPPPRRLSNRRHRTDSRAGWMWTPNERWQIEDLLHQGYTYEQIAARMKRPVMAVKIKLHRRKLSYRRVQGVYSCVGVARLLGVPQSQTVAGWIARGWLKARHTTGVHKARWRINEWDLLQMLERRDTWMAWDADRITEPGLRDWARDMRAVGRWVMTSEVARRFHVSIDSVNYWARQGLLDTVKYNSYHWIWEADLDSFVPPCDRPRGPGRSLTTEETVAVRHAVAGGATYQSQAQQYEVSVSQIARVIATASVPIQRRQPKMTDDDVRTLRRLPTLTPRDCERWARRCGMAPHTIRAIYRRDKRRNVPDVPPPART